MPQFFLQPPTFAPTGPVGACEIDTYTFGNKSFGTAPSAETVPTWLEIVADTTYPQTTTDAYLIKDAAESIVSKARRTKIQQSNQTIRDL